MPALKAVGKPEKVEKRTHDYSHEFQQTVQRLYGREEPKLFGQTWPNPWLARTEWGGKNNDLADFVRNYPA